MKVVAVAVETSELDYKTKPGGKESGLMIKSCPQTEATEAVDKAQTDATEAVDKACRLVILMLEPATNDAATNDAAT